MWAQITLPAKWSYAYEITVIAKAMPTSISLLSFKYSLPPFKRIGVLFLSLFLLYFSKLLFLYLFFVEKFRSRF